MFIKSVAGRKSECTCARVILDSVVEDHVCFTSGAPLMAPAVCSPEKPPVSG